MKLAVYLGMAAFLCAGSLLWSGQVEHLDTKKRKMLQNLFLLAAGALFVGPAALLAELPGAALRLCGAETAQAAAVTPKTSTNHS